MATDKLKIQLGEFFGLNANAITLYWKARVGLYCILEALGVGPGDEVIIPAYTCVVVPNAIKYLGASPVYVDIDPKTYNIDPSKIEASITSKSKVLLAQNTYGLSADIDPLKKIAKHHQLAVIEDCTHGFGGTYKGGKNGLNVDAAFFSTQWNKTFSTGVGGFVVCKDKQLAQKMAMEEKKLSPPSLSAVRILRLQIMIRRVLGYSGIYWSSLKFYRFLSSHNVIVGSSSKEELAGFEFPEDYLTAFSEMQAKHASLELIKIKENLSHRAYIAGRIDHHLKAMGKEIPFRPKYATHTVIKYPLLVRQRNWVMEQALKRNIPLGDWFLSPIHPIKENLEKWDLEREQFPIASKISNHMVNIPTDLLVTPALCQRVLKFLVEINHEIVSFEEL